VGLRGAQMLRKNIYLDELGLSRKGYGGNFVKENKIKRFIERRKYGFDYRDVFNMDISFAEWLYSHMKMYKEHSVHGGSNIEFEGRTYELDEAVDLVIDVTGDYLKLMERVSDLEGEALENLKMAGRLFLTIMGYCWL